MDPEDNWDTPDFRRSWVEKIAALKPSSKSGVNINPELLEKEIFLRCKSKAEYLRYCEKLQSSIKAKLAALESKNTPQGNTDTKSENPNTSASFSSLNRPEVKENTEKSSESRLKSLRFFIQHVLQDSSKTKFSQDFINNCQNWSKVFQKPNNDVTMDEINKCEKFIQENFGEIDEIELKILEMQSSKGYQTSPSASTSKVESNYPVSDLEKLTIQQAPWNQKKTQIPPLIPTNQPQLTSPSFQPSLPTNSSPVNPNRPVVFTSKRPSLPLEKETNVPVAGNVLFSSVTPNQPQKVISIPNQQPTTSNIQFTVPPPVQPNSPSENQVGKINVVNFARMRSPELQQSQGQNTSLQPPLMIQRSQSIQTLPQSSIDAQKMPPPTQNFQRSQSLVGLQSSGAPNMGFYTGGQSNPNQMQNTQIQTAVGRNPTENIGNWNQNQMQISRQNIVNQPQGSSQIDEVYQNWRQNNPNPPPNDQNIIQGTQGTPNIESVFKDWKQNKHNTAENYQNISSNEQDQNSELLRQQLQKQDQISQSQNIERMDQNVESMNQNIGNMNQNIEINVNRNTVQENVSILQTNLENQKTSMNNQELIQSIENLTKFGESSKVKELKPRRSSPNLQELIESLGEVKKSDVSDTKFQQNVVEMQEDNLKSDQNDTIKNTQQNSANLQQNKEKFDENNANLQQDSVNLQQNSVNLRQNTEEQDKNNANLQQNNANLQQNNANLHENIEKSNESNSNLQQNTNNQKNNADLQENNEKTDEKNANLQQNDVNFLQNNEKVDKNNEISKQSNENSQVYGSNLQQNYENPEGNNGKSEEKQESMQVDDENLQQNSDVPMESDNNEENMNKTDSNQSKTLENDHEMSSKKQESLTETVDTSDKEPSNTSKTVEESQNQNKNNELEKSGENSSSSKESENKNDPKDWRVNAKNSITKVASLLESKALEKFSTKEDYMDFFKEIFQFAREKLEDDSNNNSTPPPPRPPSIHLVKTRNVYELEKLLSNEPQNMKRRVFMEWRALDDQVRHLINVMPRDGSDIAYDPSLFQPDEFEIQANRFIAKLRQPEPDPEVMEIL